MWGSGDIGLGPGPEPGVCPGASGRGWPLRQVPFSVQALHGVSTPGLFLSEAFLGQHVEALGLEGSEPEPGDGSLLRLRSLTGAGAGCALRGRRSVAG